MQYKSVYYFVFYPVFAIERLGIKKAKPIIFILIEIEYVAVVELHQPMFMQSDCLSCLRPKSLFFLNKKPKNAYFFPVP